MLSKEQWIYTVCKLEPSMENDKIDLRYSPNRVLRLVRLLKNLGCKELYMNKTKYHAAVSQSYYSKLEKMQSVMSWDVILHMSTLLDISPELFIQYTLMTAHMSWKEAAMYIGSDIINNTLDNT